MTGVSAVMIAYENEQKSLLRLRRDLLPALRGFDTELIVIDNSARRSSLLALSVKAARGDYRWQGGDNLLYGPAMNLAVKLATKPYLLYVCSNHGRSRDHSWAADLLAPLEDDATVAMTGSLWPSGDPMALGYSAELPWHHIQGGVFAARRDTLLTHPWPDGQYAHYLADLDICFRLMGAGLKLIDVPTVKSVWQDDPGSGDWKYLHIGGTSVES